MTDIEIAKNTKLDEINKIAEKLGHTVTAIKPSLVPIILDLFFS